MKNLLSILALSTALFTMISCQKEAFSPENTAISAPEAQPATEAQAPSAAPSAESSAIQTWVLLEQKWVATVVPGNPATLALASATGGSMTATAVPVSQLPTAVTDEMAALGVAIPATATVWAIAGGGFLIDVPTAGFPNRIFWFNGQNKLKTIGHVQP